MFDDVILDVFLRDQKKLYDEPVAYSREEAKEFLEEVCAVVCDSAKECFEILDDEMDAAGIDISNIGELEEVFEIGDGRYLIVEG